MADIKKFQFILDGKIANNFKSELSKIGGTINELNDTQVVVDFNENATMANFKKLYQRLEKENSELTVQFRYDINKLMLEKAQKEMSQLEVYVDANKANKEILELANGLKNINLKLEVDGISESEEDKLFKQSEEIADKIGKIISTHISIDGSTKIFDGLSNEVKTIIESFTSLSKIKEIKPFDTKNIEKQRLDIENIKTAMSELEVKGATSFGGGKFDDSKVEELHKEIAEVKEDISSLKGRVDTLEDVTAFDTLSSKANDFGKEINTINNSVTALQKVLDPLFNGINQVYKENNGNHISGYWSQLKEEIEGSNTELKELLKSVGLYDSKSNGLKLISDGMVNSGGLIGDERVLIARKNKNDRLEQTHALKNALDEAHASGINVSRILDVIGTKESNVFLEVQEAAKGNILGNIYGQLDNDFVNTEWLEATDEQIKKLISDMIALQKMGINVESNLTNIMYDKKKGFSFIDMDLDITKFENDAELIEDHMIRIFGDLEDFYIDKNDAVNANMIAKVRKRFENLSEQVQQAYAEAQASNSPSKEFEKLENDAVDGIVVGANKNEDKLKNVGKQMADNVKDGFKEAMSDIDTATLSPENQSTVLSGGDATAPVEDLQKVEIEAEETRKSIQELENELLKFASTYKISFNQDAKYDYEFERNYEIAQKLQSVLDEIYKADPSYSIDNLISSTQEEFNKATAGATEFNNVLKEVRKGTGQWSYNKLLNDPDKFAQDLNAVADEYYKLIQTDGYDEKQLLNIEARFNAMLSSQHKLYTESARLNDNYLRGLADKIQSQLTSTTSDLQDQFGEGMANGKNMSSDFELREIVKDRLGYSFNVDDEYSIDHLQEILDFLRNIETVKKAASKETLISNEEANIAHNLELSREFKERYKKTEENYGYDSDPEWFENQYKYIAEYANKAEEAKAKLAELKGEIYEIQRITPEDVKAELTGNQSSVLSGGEDKKLDTFHDKAQNLVNVIKEIYSQFAGTEKPLNNIFHSMLDENAPEEIIKVADALDLLYESYTITSRIIQEGTTNLGGILSNPSIIGDTEKGITILGKPIEDLEFIKDLKPRLEAAKKEGANVAQILDYVVDDTNKIVYEFQETAQGHGIGFGTQNAYTSFLEATDEQILKLISDIEILQKHGLALDLRGDNILFDKENGFSFIDLATDLGYKSGNQNVFGALTQMTDHAQYTGGVDSSVIETFEERVWSLLDAHKANTMAISAETEAERELANARKEANTQESNKTPLSLVEESSGQLALFEGVEEQQKEVKTAIEKTNDAIEGQITLVDYLNDQKSKPVEPIKDTFDANTSDIKAETAAIEENTQALKENQKAQESQSKSKPKNKEIITNPSKEGFKAPTGWVKDINKAWDNANSENAIKNYEELINKVERYYSLLAKNNKGELVGEEKSEFESLQKQIEKATKSLNEFNGKGKYFNEIVKKFKISIGKLDEKSGLTDLYRKDGRNDIFEDLSNKDVVSSKINGYEQKVNDLKTIFLEIKDLVPIDVTNTEDADRLEYLNKQFDELAQNLRSNEYNPANQLEVDRLTGRISDTLFKNTAAPREIRKEMEALVAQLKQVGLSQADVDKIRDSFSRLEAQMKATGKTGDSLGTKITKKFKDVAAYFATYVSIQDAIQVLRQGFETIKEYDTALTEMNKVSDESIQTLKEFQKESFGLADAVGTTASQIQNSTADFLRLGESFEMAKQSAQDANALFKVSEFESINEATDALISMSQAYSELGKGEINDVLNYVGNNFSSSTEDLAVALQDAAAVLKTQGNDLYQSVAMVVAGNAITQDASKTAGGIRTISLRIAGKYKHARTYRNIWALKCAS